MVGVEMHRAPDLPIGTDAEDGRDADPEQLSSPVDREIRDGMWL
jgi:hypothetical protein